MNPSRLSYYTILYALVVLLAFGVRLVNLGALPLSESESELALPAFQTAQGERVAWGTQPAYTSLTSLAFSLLGSQDFIARLWPALAGGLLSIAPFLFRKKIGRLPSLILAIGLALDPGLVAVSRQASGPMMAASCTILALGFAYSRLPVAAGIATSLALLSGRALWPGLVGIAVGWGVAWLVSRTADDLDEAEGFVGWGPITWRSFLISLVVTFLLVGTQFLHSPQGVSSWLAGLPAYLSGWGVQPATPGLRIVGALGIYAPLALVFGLVGAVRAWLRKDSFTRLLSIWFLVGVLIAIIYPARQVNDLTWALIPLWGLAAIELGRSLDQPIPQPLVSVAQAGLLFLLSALFWSSLAGFAPLGPKAPGYTMRLGVMGGIMGLGAVTTSLVGLGWTWQSARQGLVIGLCAILGTYSLASMVWSTQVDDPGRVELWRPVPAPGDIRLMVDTISDLSNWDVGERQAIDVTLAVDSPALRWALRDYSRLTVVPEGDQLLTASSPSIVITLAGVDVPSLAAAYRGQDFVLRTYPGWDGAYPPRIAHWLVFRDAPLRDLQAILWARTDLFPGGGVLPENPRPEEELLQP